MMAWGIIVSRSKRRRTDSTSPGPTRRISPSSVSNSGQPDPTTVLIDLAEKAIELEVTLASRPM
jgi:hypothetical protein